MAVIAVILITITTLIIIGDFFFGFREHGTVEIILLVKTARILFWGSLLYLFLSSAKRKKTKDIS